MQNKNLSDSVYKPLLKQKFCGETSFFKQARKKQKKNKLSEYYVQRLYIQA
jgi:hypothetical protein